MTKTTTKRATKKQIVENYVDALESAEQVKSWNKYGDDMKCTGVLFVGLLLGFVAAAIVVTPSIIQACN